MAPDLDDEALIEFAQQAIPNLVALYRFGSQVEESARSESDVDFAVLTPHPLPTLRRFKLVRYHCTVIGHRGPSPCVHRDVHAEDLDRRMPFCAE